MPKSLHILIEVKRITNKCTRNKLLNILNIITFATKINITLSLFNWPRYVLNQFNYISGTDKKWFGKTFTKCYQIILLLYSRSLPFFCVQYLALKTKLSILLKIHWMLKTFIYYQNGSIFSNIYFSSINIHCILRQMWCCWK